MRLWLTMDCLGCVELWGKEPEETPSGAWACEGDKREVRVKGGG